MSGRGARITSGEISAAFRDLSAIWDGGPTLRVKVYFKSMHLKPF